MPKKHPPEAVADARRLYAEGMRVTDIMAATGLPVGSLYYHLDGGALRGPRPPAAPRRRVVVRNRPQNALAARILRIARREALAIEQRLGDPTRDSDAQARDLRALGTVARLIRDLAAFEPREPEPRQSKEMEQMQRDARWLEVQAKAARVRAEIKQARAAWAAEVRW